jgi:hypothetical protein
MDQNLFRHHESVTANAVSQGDEAAMISALLTEVPALG